MSDYKPVDCGFHSELEVAIMHGSTLQVRYHQPGQPVQEQQIKPIDLQTRQHEEYLIFENQQGKRDELRLDYLQFIE